MPTPKKKNTCASTKALAIILGSIALILLFTLFTREQTVRSLKDEKAALEQSSNELQQNLDDGQKMSLAQRLGTAGIDTLNLWKLETENCLQPYCRASWLKIEGVEDVVYSITTGLNRWKGYVTNFVIQSEATEGGETIGSSCEAFAIEGGAIIPINLDLLANVEKKILRSSSEKDQIEITVHYTEYGTVACDVPAYVLNVHLE